MHYIHRLWTYIPLPRIYLQDILNGPGLCRYILDAGYIVCSTDPCTCKYILPLQEQIAAAAAGYLSDTYQYYSDFHSFISLRVYIVEASL